MDFQWDVSPQQAPTTSYHLLARTLLQRMAPLFAKSGMRFECEMVDTVACQKMSNNTLFKQIWFWT